MECSTVAVTRRLEQFTQLVISEKLTDLRPVVVAGLGGEFWRSRCTNQKGQILLEGLAKLDIHLTNVGCTSTFSRNVAELINDVTFVNPGLVKDWRVDDGYTFNDHQEIRYGVDHNTGRHAPGRPNTPTIRKWKTSYFDVDMADPSAERLVAILSRATSTGRVCAQGEGCRELTQTRGVEWFLWPQDRRLRG